MYRLFDLETDVISCVIKVILHRAFSSLENVLALLTKDQGLLLKKNLAEEMKISHNYQIFSPLIRHPISLLAHIR